MSSVPIVYPPSTVASCGEPHLGHDALAPRESIDVRVAQNDARGRVRSALELLTVVIDHQSDGCDAAIAFQLLDYRNKSLFRGRSSTTVSQGHTAQLISATRARDEHLPPGVCKHGLRDWSVHYSRSPHQT